MGEIWTGFSNIFARGIEVLHDLIAQVDFLSAAAWGWAIIALTVVVRIILLPLAAKQFTSMRRMQELQPQVKKIQEKYKVDRSLMKSDPERYRELSTKKNEALQALYREEGVNPAAGCLPLLAQGPVFFALFRVLQNPPDFISELSDADFYFFTPGPQGLSETASAAGAAGILLLLLVAGSMFVSQKQMMARNTNSGGGGDMQATQQKVMLYAMPVMMGVFGFNLPIGVLLYWVTTNVWTMGQQWFITRRVEEETDGGRGGPGGGGSGRGPEPATPPGGNGGRRNVDATGRDATGTAGNTRRAVPSPEPEAEAEDGSRWPSRRSSRLPSRTPRRSD